jgi:hypothetical protein
MCDAFYLLPTIQSYQCCELRRIRQYSLWKALWTQGRPLWDPVGNGMSILQRLQMRSTLYHD